ncbi:uncharacterized protein LOC144321940 isoform X11 [Canis aureus]
MKIKYTSNFMSTMCIIVKHSRWRIYYTFWQRILNQEPTRISKAAKRNIITQCLVVRWEVHCQPHYQPPVSTGCMPGIKRRNLMIESERSHFQEDQEKE